MLKNNNNNKIVKSFNPATSSNCCPKNKSFNHYQWLSIDNDSISADSDQQMVILDYDFKTVTVLHALSGIFRNLPGTSVREFNLGGYPISTPNTSVSSRLAQLHKLTFSTVRTTALLLYFWQRPTADNSAATVSDSISIVSHQCNMVVWYTNHQSSLLHTQNILSMFPLHSAD